MQTKDNNIYLGLAGKMGSGKSTLAHSLKSLVRTLDIEVISLAKPVKDLQYLVYNELDINLTKDKNRELLIAIAMIGRDHDEDYWLNKAIESFRKHNGKLIICDDVRLVNEAEWFKSNGVLVRLEGTQRGSNVNDKFALHNTETALDNFNFNYYIKNMKGEMDNTVHQLVNILMEYIESRRDNAVIKEEWFSRNF